MTRGNESQSYPEWHAQKNEEKQQSQQLNTAAAHAGTDTAVSKLDVSGAYIVAEPPTARTPSVV